MTRKHRGKEQSRGWKRDNKKAWKGKEDDRKKKEEK